MIEIINYSKEHAAAFKQLNIEWLDAYNLVEPHDLEVLDDPEGTVLDKGGCIWLAKHKDKIVGSAALIKEPGNMYELAKMSVAPAFRGMGISKMLLEKCIGTAKQGKAEKIILFSNSQLKTALRLYEKYGFKYVPVSGTSFLSADIKMELSLPLI